jgi:hypothetical protein
MVGATLGHVSDLVNLAAAAGGFEHADAHLTRSPLTLDQQGFKEVAEKLDKLLAELDEVNAAAERRLAQVAEDDRIRATVVLMLFESAPELEESEEEQQASVAH